MTLPQHLQNQDALFDCSILLAEVEDISQNHNTIHTNYQDKSIPEITDETNKRNS